MKFNRSLLLTLVIFSVREDGTAQVPRQSIDPVVNLIFDNLQVAGIKTDQQFKYSYFFESKSLKTLQKLQKNRSLNKYILIDYYVFADSSYTMHLERKEKHTKESLTRCEADFSTLATEYDGVLYTGFDIGITRVILPPITDDRFIRPISTKSDSDLYRLGFLYYKLELIKDAIETFERCVDLKIYPDTSHLILSNLYSFNLRDEKSLAHAKAAITINPGYANAYYNLGRMLYDRGDMDYALSIYLTAEKLKPRDDDILSQIARIYFERRDFNSAKQYVEKTLKINPANSTALYFEKAVKEVK